MAQSTLNIGTELQSSTIKYKITEILGQGSFGVTYKAKGFTVVKGALGEMQMEMPMPIAIKEFFMKDITARLEDGSITGLTEGGMAYNYSLKFRKEAQNLAEMNHPNIVRVIDFIEANNTFYYVMEYIDGEDLNHYIKNNNVSVSEAIGIIKDVANALIYMHEERHVLHLDLKPGNIMRQKSDGKIVLIDFGLSKHFSDEGQPETSTTVGLGTPGYAPVEQGAMSAKNKELLPTIDVYALGATLFKLLTGETPPTASDVIMDDEILEEVLDYHNVAENYKKVILKAMKPSAKKRTQTVREFLGMLGKPVPEVKEATQFVPQDNEQTIVAKPKVQSKPEPVLIDVEPDEETIIEAPHSIVFDNGHKYVDLGLSVKWAQCNVGARTGFETGMLFPFAETGNPMSLPSSICGDSVYDSCSKIMGGDWRLPTKEEQDELRTKCSWMFDLNVKCYKVTGPNGNFIYLPVTETVSSYSNNRYIGNYWSGDLHVSNKKTAYYLHFDISKHMICWMNEDINSKFAIRGVIE